MVAESNSFLKSWVILSRDLCDSFNNFNIDNIFSRFMLSKDGVFISTLGINVWAKGFRREIALTGVLGDCFAIRLGMAEALRCDVWGGTPRAQDGRNLRREGIDRLVRLLRCTGNFLPSGNLGDLGKVGILERRENELGHRINCFGGI
jgi:hypothetical protein